MALSAEQRAFLDELNFAVLATINADGSPQLTTVWYLREGNDLVFNTAAGRLKDRNPRRDPRLAVTVLGADGYRYLTVRGTARLDEASGQEVIHRLAVRYRGEAEAAENVRVQFSKERRVTIRLPLDEVYVYGFDDHE